MAPTGKRGYSSLKIAEIDHPQLAEEVTWQAKARKVMRTVLTDAKVQQYMEARLEAAMQGDRVACAQVDRMLGVGVPVTINVHPAIEAKPAPLLDRIVQVLRASECESLTFAQIAAQLQVTDDEVRVECVKHLAKKDRQLFLCGPTEVTLEASGVA